MIKQQRTFALLAVGLYSVAGCDASVRPLAQVSGRVSRGAQPMANATITFQPIAKANGSPNPGPGSFGRTDAAGRYTLRTFDVSDRVGAIVGRHRVTIRHAAAINLSDASGETKSAEMPSVFIDGSLIVEVPLHGLDHTDFDLAQAKRK